MVLMDQSLPLGSSDDRVIKAADWSQEVERFMT